MKERRSVNDKLNEIKDKVSNITFWLIHMLSKLVTAEFMLHNSMNKHLAQSVMPLIIFYTGCPKKHGNSVTNWISSLLWISIVIPNFKSHNIIMSARVYFMKRVKYCKDVSYVSARWRVKTDKFTLCVYCNFLVLLSTTYTVKT